MFERNFNFLSPLLPKSFSPLPSLPIFVVVFFPHDPKVDFHSEIINISVAWKSMQSASFNLSPHCHSHPQKAISSLNVTYEAMSNSALQNKMSKISSLSLGKIAHLDEQWLNLNNNNKKGVVRGDSTRHRDSSCQVNLQFHGFQHSAYSASCVKATENTD